VKRVIASFAGRVGIAALGRWLARRAHRATDVVEVPSEAAGATAEAPVEAPEGDPAEELRRTLAAARPGEPDAETAPAEETLEERRARVHAKAREALGAMTDDEEAG
jgi:hypothetical protein